MLGESIRRYGDLLRIANTPGSLSFAVGEVVPDLKKPFNLAEQIAATDTKIGATGVLLLDGTGVGLSNRERIGVMLFSGIVYLADDIVDNQRSIPSNSQQLKDIINSSSVTLPGGTLLMSEVIDTATNTFAEHKQQILLDFLESMIEFQIKTGNKGFPGQYGFQKAWSYKKETNMAFINTGLTLAENNSYDLDSLLSSVLGVQMYDDAFDVVDDSVNGLENLFVGLAKDVWEVKGKPTGEDLDLIISKIKVPTAKFGSKSLVTDPRLRDTRLLYRLTFNSLLGEFENVPLKNGIWLKSLSAF